MLDLSRVTLLFVETRAHKITKRVIDDCISKVKFGEILIYTDNPDLIPVVGARYIEVPDFPNKREAGRFYYQYACSKITTEFALMLEWDGGIHDVKQWTDEFFNYDCIGAPWVVPSRDDDRRDVGNGGFMLMSRKLGLHLAKYPQEHPVFTDIDLCQAQRPGLERAGFKWAPKKLANRFSWELTPQPENVFGFHATFTWPWMISRPEVIARATLMTESPYLLSKMKDLVRKAPWLANEMPPEAWTRYAEYSPSPTHRGTPFEAAQRAKMNHILTQRRALYQSQIARPGLKA